MTAPRDELATQELTRRGRIAIAGFVVLALAVVAIATLRPDRQGVGTPLAVASASPPSPSPSPAPPASPAPSPSYLPPRVPPPLAAKTGSRLVVVQGTKLELLDVDAGAATPFQTDYRLVDHDRIDVLSVGKQLVMVGDDQTGAGTGPYPAYATTNGPGSPMHTIGQAGYLVPSDHAGRVWLSDVTQEPSTTLTEVDLQGRVYRHAGFEGTFGADPFAGGYLRQTVMPDKSEGEDVELVDDSGKRRLLYKHVSVLVVSGDTALLADRVACAKKCDLHVLTAGSTVTEHVLHLGATPDLIEAGITNDSSRLFVGVRQESTSPAPSLISELSLTSGAMRQMTDAYAATYYGASYQFTPDGRWMFFVDADEKHVNAYDLAARRAYRVKGDFAQITQLELLA